LLTPFVENIIKRIRTHIQPKNRNLHTSNIKNPDFLPVKNKNLFKENKFQCPIEGNQKELRIKKFEILRQKPLRMSNKARYRVCRGN